MDSTLSAEVASLFAASYASAVCAGGDLPMQDLVVMATFSARAAGADEALAAEATAVAAHRADDVKRSVVAMAAELVASVTLTRGANDWSDAEDLSGRIAGMINADRLSDRRTDRRQVLQRPHTKGAGATRSLAAMERAIILRGVQSATIAAEADTNPDAKTVMAHVASSAERACDGLMSAARSLAGAAAGGQTVAQPDPLQGLDN